MSEAIHWISGCTFAIGVAFFIVARWLAKDATDSYERATKTLREASDFYQRARGERHGHE